MCVICHFEPGFVPSFGLIQMAAWNNPHGYGLILKENKKLHVIKKCPVDGNDPEEIYKLLEEHKDVERFLHLRWKTEGDIDLDNTQPFTVFNGKRQIEFCHNGTLNDWAPNRPGYYSVNKPKEETVPDELKNASDSRRFCELKLRPLLMSITGPKGTGDYTTEIAREILGKYWSGGHNRGLIIANDLPPLYLGDWTQVKDKIEFGGETIEYTFKASNDTYFERLSRGPMFQKQQEEARKKREEEEAERRKNAPVVSQIRTASKNVTLVSSALFKKRYQLSGDLVANILSDWKIHEEPGMRALCNMTMTEIEEMYTKLGSETPSFIFYLLNQMHENFKELDKMRQQYAEVH